MQRPLYITALAAFLLDQITKVFVVFFLDLQNIMMIEVLPPFLNFSMAWNYGVNFGLFAHDSPWTRWVLIVIAIGVSVFIAYWAWKERFGPWTQVFAGLLIGGALGNAYDRIRYGAVVDFLNMSCCGIQNPYAFNVADIFIFVGAIGLAIFPQPKKDG